jgi:hypothetical protein
MGNIQGKYINSRDIKNINENTNIITNIKIKSVIKSIHYTSNNRYFVYCTNNTIYIRDNKDITFYTINTKLTNLHVLGFSDDFQNIIIHDYKKSLLECYSIYTGQNLYTYYMNLDYKMIQYNKIDNSIIELCNNDIISYNLKKNMYKYTRDNSYCLVEYLYNLKTPNVNNFQTFIPQIYYICISNNCNLLASASLGYKDMCTNIQIWNIPSGNIKYSCHLKINVLHLCFSTVGDNLFMASDNKIYKYNIDSKKIYKIYESSNSKIYKFKVSNNMKYIAIQKVGGNIDFYNIVNNKCTILYNIINTVNIYGDFCFSPDDLIFATAFGSNIIEYKTPIYLVHQQKLLFLLEINTKIKNKKLWLPIKKINSTIKNLSSNYLFDRNIIPLIFQYI